MNKDCSVPGAGADPDASLRCPSCETDARSVSHETLYHQLVSFEARAVVPEQTYGVCRTRSCSVIYFSADRNRVWETSNVRTTVGFKQSEDDSPKPVCYCFGYTEENIAREIERTGDSTVIDWITERVQEDECACEYKNPTGRCCLRDVRETVQESTGGEG